MASITSDFTYFEGIYISVSVTKYTFGCILTLFITGSLVGPNCKRPMSRDFQDNLFIHIIYQFWGVYLFLGCKYNDLQLRFFGNKDKYKLRIRTGQQSGLLNW